MTKVVYNWASYPTPDRVHYRQRELKAKLIERMTDRNIIQVLLWEDFLVEDGWRELVIELMKKGSIIPVDFIGAV